MLTFLLSAYALSIFGYITAFLATFFIGRDANTQARAPSAEAIAELSAQVEALRRELRGSAGEGCAGPRTGGSAGARGIRRGVEGSHLSGCLRAKQVTLSNETR